MGRARSLPAGRGRRPRDCLCAASAARTIADIYAHPTVSRMGRRPTHTPTRLPWEAAAIFGRRYAGCAQREIQGSKLKLDMTRRVGPELDSQLGHELRGVLLGVGSCRIILQYRDGLRSRKKYAEVPVGAFWADIAARSSTHGAANSGGCPDLPQPSSEFRHGCKRADALLMQQRSHSRAEGYLTPERTK